MPNGTDAPGKLLISPAVPPPDAVPMSVFTCSTGFATNKGTSARAVGGAAIGSMQTTATPTSAVRAVARNAGRFAAGPLRTRCTQARMDYARVACRLDRL